MDGIAAAVVDRTDGAVPGIRHPPFTAGSCRLRNGCAVQCAAACDAVYGGDDQLDAVCYTGDDGVSDGDGQLLSEVSQHTDSAGNIWHTVRGRDVFISVSDAYAGKRRIHGMADFSFLMGLRYVCLLCGKADRKA